MLAPTKEERLMDRTGTILMLAVTGALALGVVDGLRTQRAVAEQHAPQTSAGGADHRAPVRLLRMMAEHQKANMRDHLVAVQQIVASLAANDFDGIVTAAGRIGYSDAMAQMCTHMGAATPGFTAMALNFHRTADAVVVGARDKDGAAVLAALNRTLQTCTGCHAAFRQEVVDAATWTQLTSPSSGGTQP
jgi:cytochrome c556